MNKSILLEILSVEDLEKILRKVFNSSIEELKLKDPFSDSEVLLSRKQACELFQINSTTLWHWTKKGKVLAYGTGNRRYYKKSELLAALKPLLK